MHHHQQQHQQQQALPRSSPAALQLPPAAAPAATDAFSASKQAHQHKEPTSFSSDVTRHIAAAVLM
jgi:hypothetical protein